MDIVDDIGFLVSSITKGNCYYSELAYRDQESKIIYIHRFAEYWCARNGTLVSPTLKIDRMEMSSFGNLSPIW